MVVHHQALVSYRSGCKTLSNIINVAVSLWMASLGIIYGSNHLHRMSQVSRPDSQQA